MKKLLLALFIPFNLLAQNPKLVVCVVVDQMRYEMLDRYAYNFGTEGFNRLTQEGFSFTNCNYNYIPTYTGPGHATIFTGKDPSHHKIIANDWYDPNKGKTVYCALDKSVKPVGTKDSDSKRSPKNMKSKSLADYVIQGKNAKSYGVSVKDRGAILPAGQNATGAFWMDKDANFVTSTYYSKKLPNWVSEFNSKKYSEQYLKKGWNLSKDKGEYKASDKDKRKVESNTFGKVVFPYDFTSLLEEKGQSIVKSTPYGNTVLLDFAFNLIENEKLGADEITDFLSISFSSTDYAGHAFGPRSVEIEDMYIKLDLEIERLLNYLNENIGEGEYILMLTSDHGVVDCPGTSTNPLEYVNSKKVKTYLDSATTAFWGSSLIEEMTNYQIWLNLDTLEFLSLDVEDTKYFISMLLAEYGEGKYFNNVWIKEDLNECQQGDCLKFKKAYSEELAGDLFFTLNPGYLLSSRSTGTSHGSGYDYDTHVPFLLYGQGIKAGNSNKNVIVQDIAPTLYDLLKLEHNAKFDGESRKALMP
ncbi:MAG: alkaline phosphatase family protein [Schleiferiaceae bacterium]|nr:alkaline phosphatase family protein [Schleiferiaceae bacterium]